MQELVNKNGNDTDTNQAPPPQNTLQMQGHATVWHKELKISGQIGEPGQKERLTHVLQSSSPNQKQTE